MALSTVDALAREKPSQSRGALPPVGPPRGWAGTAAILNSKGRRGGPNRI